MRFACLVAFLLAGCAADSISEEASDLTGYQRQIYLEYDYMVAPDGRSDAPLPQSMQMVIDAFAAHGITLHIDPRHDAIPMQPLTFGECVGAPGSVDFYALKAAHFDRKGQPEYHYVIFGDEFLSSFYGCMDVGSTGISELPGNDFLVTVGGSLRYIPSSLRAQLWPFFEGGTFMHELGHNLGLRHGGADEINYKPNYMSIMNYSFQLRGIPSAASLGSTVAVAHRLDYSAQKLAPLDETHLDETVGIGAGNTDITAFTNGAYVDTNGPASGPIDWDGDGAIDNRDAAVDITSDGYLSTMDGFDDWSNLNLAFQRPPGFANRPLPSVARDELRPQ